MVEHQVLPALVAEKLTAFDRLASEFEASFQYVQDMQGQRRLPAIPIAGTVRYLHALWICECKDRLLSVPRTIQRYEGQRCLELLREWQGGESADVVAFLQRKLDGLPLAELTRQVEIARTHPSGATVADRLRRGRLVLLNRGFNLFQALDPMFALPEGEVADQVRAACREYDHAPLEIAEQIEALQGRLYSYVRHPALAQRNMLVMDRLGVRVTDDIADRPGHRTERTASPTVPAGPFAEQVIDGYVLLTTPRHNNPAGARFVDRPERVRPRPLTQPGAAEQQIIAEDDGLVQGEVLDQPDLAQGV